MSLTRALNKLICRVLIGVFVFAQMAVAGYACPALQGTSTQATEVQTDMTGSMPGCDQMDRDAPNLCAEHCRFGQQSSDTAPVPVVIAPAPAVLYLLPADADSVAEASGPPSSANPLLAAKPPPHAILHCVWRI